MIQIQSNSYTSILLRSDENIWNEVIIWIFIVPDRFVDSFLQKEIDFCIIFFFSFNFVKLKRSGNCFLNWRFGNFNLIATNRFKIHLSGVIFVHEFTMFATLPS